jgi:competence protein ComEA
VIFNFSKKIIREFLSFSRMEVRGLIVLAVLMILLISIKIYIKTRSNIFELEIIKKEGTIDNKENDTKTSELNSFDKAENYKNRMPFDPNKADYNEFKDFGIKEKVIQNIIKYREKGGKFNKSEDLLKIYGLDTLLYYKLLPFIKIIKSDSTLNEKTKKKNWSYTINLNTADTTDLMSIPGIGSVLSRRILKYRNMLGGYYYIDQLKEVYGISDSLFNTFSAHLQTDTSLIQRININTCEPEDLKKHPYITNYQVKAIQNFRKLSGPFTSKSQLIENYLLSEDNYVKLAPYLTLK